MITEKEFTEIVKKTKKIVLSAIAKYLAANYSYLIDDVAQETYLRAYTNLKKKGILENSSIQAWLYTIARNETFRQLSKIKKENEKKEKIKLKYINDLPEISANLKEDDLIDLIEKLPMHQRKVYNLALKGYKGKEIAARLKIARGTVKSRLARGRIELQRLIMEETNG